MKLAAIHHVAIIVSNYEKARDFYVNKLGFAVVRENFRKERNDWKLDLSVGDGADAIELEIFAEPNPPERVNRPEACGLRHLAFRVDDALFLLVLTLILYLNLKRVIMQKKS